MKRSDTDQSVYFSALRGGMIYRFKRTGRDPLPGADYPPRKPRYREMECPILSPLRDARSREELFLRRLSVMGEEHFYHIERKIRRPPRTDGILWPVDLVLLSDAQRLECYSAVARAYSDRPLSAMRRQSERFALAFRNPRGFRAGNLAEAKRTKKLEPFHWKNPSVRNLVVGLLDILRELNDDSYYYHDFHLSRVFLTAERKPLLDYSEMIMSLEDADFPALDAERRDYPPEFADPAVMRGVIPAPDFHSQNYSLCAFLFYLLFGFCPYDGDSLRYLKDDTSHAHYKKFLLHYHADIPPAFVFDPNDTRNSLGLFGEDEALIALWEEAPDALRQQFADAFSESNVMRRSDDGPRFPDPAVWLDCLHKIGWA